MWADAGKVLTGALAIVVLGIVLGLWDIDFNPAKTPAARPGINFLENGERAPREFLYLDSVRAAAYLSQLSGGNETLRTISDTLSRKLGGELTLGAAKISGEAA